MTALIVIPVFNEAATIGEVVAAARALAPVLVVDDGSADGSEARARAAGAEVIRHPRRLGKGQAIRTGIAAARSRGASVIVTMDGDGQHDPRDLGAVLDAARRSPRSIVVGGRLGEARVLPPDRLSAIRVAGFFVNWVSGLRLEDTQSGFRAYPLGLFDEVRLRRGGFVFETEVLIAAALRGWRVVEVPVRAIPRARRRSRFRPLGDGVAIGAYLAGCVMARWGLEARAAGWALVGPFLPAARRARHAEILGAAAPHLGSPGAWALAIGGAQLVRVATGLAGWWRHPRRRRAAVAARATLAAPAILGLLLVQALAGRRDFVSPIVGRLCSQARLDAAPAAPAAPAPDPVLPLVVQREPRR
ncbi:MAG: glycosyltransferase family 2 protein [Candidatus Rokubacteria bacterium]|nr:glycosyltransferase family 2 protein [Candidatus Rokubacteria bacterium]